jgi:site-specific DNA recombinase
MSYRSRQPIIPRNGHTLVVGIAARISGCANQKELSLDDQLDHGKQTVVERYDGPVEYKTISTRGKGEWLDRPELAEIEAMLRTRELDLLVVEDLGRLVRGTEAYRLCAVAVDHGTRVIAPNDCVDTDDGSWEEDVISACRDHVGHNSHTSKRLKQKLMKPFRQVRRGDTTADLRLYQDGGLQDLRRLGEGPGGRSHLRRVGPQAARGAQLHGRG